MCYLGSILHLQIRDKSELLLPFSFGNCLVFPRAARLHDKMEIFLKGCMTLLTPAFKAENTNETMQGGRVSLNKTTII